MARSTSKTKAQDVTIDVPSTTTRKRLSPEAKISVGQKAYEMREQRIGWLEVGEACGFTGPSRGIPAREAMYAYMAANGLMTMIDPSDHEAIIKARRGDAGWANLAARTGLRVSDLKAIVRNADASLVDKTDGVKAARTYGKDERGADGHGAQSAEQGRVTVVRRPDIAKAADERRKAAAKPAPAKRTRRTRKAA